MQMPSDKGGSMITSIAEHWGTPESGDKGMEAFKRNTERLKKTEGVVSRQVLRSLTDPGKYTTVTTFKTKEDYEEFVKELEQRRAQRPANAPKIFFEEKSEAYEVLGSA